MVSEDRAYAVSNQIKGYLNFPQELDPESDEQRLVNLLVPLCAPLNDELLVESLNRIPPVMSLETRANFDPALCEGIFQRGLKWLQGPGQNSERNSKEDLLHQASKVAITWPNTSMFLIELDKVLDGRVVVPDSDDDADGPDDAIFERYEFSGDKYASAEPSRHHGRKHRQDKGGRA